MKRAPYRPCRIHIQHTVLIHSQAPSAPLSCQYRSNDWSESIFKGMPSNTLCFCWLLTLDPSTYESPDWESAYLYLKNGLKYRNAVNPLPGVSLSNTFSFVLQAINLLQSSRRSAKYGMFFSRHVRSYSIHRIPAYRWKRAATSAKTLNECEYIELIEELQRTEEGQGTPRTLHQHHHLHHL